MTKPCEPFLSEAIGRGVFPGASFQVLHKGQVHLNCQVGAIDDEQSEPTQSQTLYDIASVTKVVSTTASIAVLLSQKTIKLSDPLLEFFPEFSGSFLAPASIKHLLTHSSGLPSTWPLRFEFDAGTPRSVIVDHLLSRDFSRVPSYHGPERSVQVRDSEALIPGARSEYSDLGMIFLGILIERVSGLSQSDFFQRFVAEPLGLQNTRYRPPAARCAPTGRDVPDRGTIRGEVHDSKAWLLGNVAGHAGLFSTAADLARFGEVARLGQHENWDAAPLLHSFGQRLGLIEDAHWGYGWKTNLNGRQAPGPQFSERCFGHDGFTGAFLWIDPDRELTMAFVTNAVYPQTPIDRQALAEQILWARRGLMERVLPTLTP